MAWVDSLIQVDSLARGGAITYILAFIALAISSYYYYKRQRMVSLIEKIPGAKGYPLIGNANEVQVNPREVFARVSGYTSIANKSGIYVIKGWAAIFPIVFLQKAEDIEVILSSSVLLDKSREYSYLYPWLGTGLLTATGKKWHSRRKMLTPAFHFKILEEFLEIFNQQSAKLTDKLLAKADGEAFNVFPFITLCTLDIILESAMGRRINAQDDLDSEYVKAIYKMGSLIQLRQTRPWLFLDVIFKLFGYAKIQEDCLKILHGFSNATIRERRAEFSKERTSRQDQETSGFVYVEKKKKRLAFLDLLLEYAESSGSNLTDEDIREQVDTFMFEGHDTTAAAINWSLYLIGSYPDIQKRIQAELDGIFGDSDRSATSADIREMKYLECCIKEALRLFPSVPIFGRELCEDVVVSDYQIPKGTTIIIITYQLHRNPEYFPDPEHFIPERFLPENSAARHPYVYIPFSAGPRNCIGQKFALMEEKVVLSSILRNFSVESTVRRENLKILGEIILRPEDGNILKLHPRK